MTDKVKLKGPLGRPLSLTNPLMTLSPVMGAGNRIYRAEEATAPAEAQTLLLLSPSAESTSPAVVLAPQLVPVILPLGLSPDSPDKAEPQSAGLPALGTLLATGFTAPTPQPPLSGGLSSHSQATNPPDKGGAGGVSKLHRGLAEQHWDLPDQYRDLSEPLALLALTSETQQRPYEVAFQTGPVLSVPLNLSQDDVVNPQDAQFLYYLALPQAPTNLSTLLNSLSATPLSDVRLAELTSLDLTTIIPDLNNDTLTNLLDVRVLYYALRFEDILRASPSLRETLLGDLTTEDNGLDADGRDTVYINLLDRVADLFPVVTTDDGAIEVDTGTSYALTTDDLSARDPDDAGAALSWTVTTAPTSGQLELSTDPDTAIMSFTQAQLEAGEVLYVHTGTDNTGDSFAVQVANPADPEGTAPVPPVTLTVTVSTPADMAPTAVTLNNVVPPLAEDADVSTRTRVADIAVTDTDLGPRDLELIGPDAALFELGDDPVTGMPMLFLIAGAALDFETNPTLEVTVQAALNPSEATADLSLALTDANEAPTTDGDGEFMVVEGASHVLTVEDLTATDIDIGDGAADLTWTFISGGQPANGRLELSGTPITPGTAIDSFTQQQLEAGEVVYVHDDSNTLSDSFTLQVEDDGGLQAADPVIVSIDITRKLDSIDLSELSVADGFVIQGGMGGDRAGQSASGAGDVNGDGFADLIVGARFGDDGGTDAGEAYVVFGRAADSGDTSPGVIDLTNLAPAAGFIIQGDANNDFAGFNVSGAGDVNGDGFADLIVGAYGGDDGGTDAGEAYIVFGKQDNFGSLMGRRRSIDLESLTPEDGFIIQGDAPGDGAGFSVSGAGDVNGDGFADLIVGARFGNDGGDLAGEAYIVFGKENDFGNDVRITLSGSSTVVRRVVDLTNLAPEDGFIIQGDTFRDNTGVSVSGAGDVNGDGFADLIIGAYGGGDGGNLAGEAYVVFGKQDDFGDDVSITLSGGSTVVRRVIDLTNLAPAAGFIIQGDAPGDGAGFSVSGAGDVNGDGFADLIIGAPSADVNTPDSNRGDAGEAYVVFGKEDDPSDPFGSLDSTNRQVVDLTNLAPEDGFIIQGDAGGDYAGRRVSAAGDVNGDGFADLIVVANKGDDGGDNAGEAYLVFGKASGPSDPFGSLMDGRRVVDLDALAPEDGFIIQGDAPNDRVGTGVSAAGDVNGDGFADLIVGAGLADVTTSEGDTKIDAGEAYVLFGGPAGLSSEAAAVLGTDGNDDLNADGADSASGEATVVLAGAGDDVLNIDGFGDNDLLRFDGGSGTDTLSLANPDADTGLDLDLSTLADTRLSSIERIDLSGNADNSLTLTRLDLLNLSEVRTEGRAELQVDGNAGDHVNIIGDWMEGSMQDIGGTMYNVFDNGNARLLVNTAVNVEIPRRIGNIDLTELTTADGFIIQGDAEGDWAGVSVSGAGDVNGDGFADLIVGASFGDDGGTDAGEAYVIFGQAADLGSRDGTHPRVVDLTNLAAGDGFIIQGDAEGDRAGVSVSGAGDVNGDGFADLIVGAHRGDDDGRSAGEAYVVFGKASHPRLIDLESLAPEDGFIIQGDEGYDNAGISVSGAGDVNGDGFADLIVGAYRGDDGGNEAGEAYLVFGKQDGFGDDVGNTLEDGMTMVDRRVVDLTNLDAGDGFIIQGDVGGDRAGGSVSSAGDVNGDGYADLLVGAPKGDDGGNEAGEAYLVFGQASTPRVIDLTNLGAGDGFIIRGDMDNDNAGVGVSSAGDVNGDGFADLIIGANLADVSTSDGNARTDAGEAYVVFGKASGFGSVIDLTNLAAGDGFIIQGDEADDRAGVSVSSAGDVNGDGYADLLVGAYRGDDGGNDAGEAYLVFGKASAPSDPFSSLDTDTNTNRRVIDLNALAPEDGFIIQGGAPGDYAGVSVSAAGDVNGDGFADLIVGAYLADVPVSGFGNTKIDAGEAYVLFGGRAGLSTEAGAVSGTDGDDVLNADGRATVVLAGAGDDVLTIDGFGDADLLKFDGGSGTDTLRLNGAGLSLDLSTLADTRLSSIERIDLSGGAPGGSMSNSLNLRRLDLLNLSELRTRGTDGTTGTVSNDASRAELRVDGNAGDRVAIDTDWMEGSRQEIDGVMYRTLDNGNARLLVNIAVAVDEVLPTTGGDGTFRVFEGRSYTLTQDDLSVRDLDDDAAALIWTVTTAPDSTRGRLALSDDPDVAISRFTQQQLEDSEVVYVHIGSDDTDDSFVVRVMDDEGNQADPVTVNVVIAGKLDNIDLTELTTADGFIIQGDAPFDYAGGSVSGAGDVNGDGFADLIVGVRFGDDGGASAGEAYVVFGKSSNPRVVDLTNLAAGDGFIIQGDEASDRAGRSVSGAGDVNGDGYADLIVGASQGDDGGNNAGEAYVVFGKAGGPSDPFGSLDSTDRRVIDLTSLAATDGFIIQGDMNFDYAGGAVSGAGDVNGDGFADLIVGAGQGDDGATEAGEAYVVFGKAGGPSDPFGSLDSTDRRVIDLTNLAAGDGFIIQGDSVGDITGGFVSGAGDVNGDGFADLIVGASGGDDGGTNAGEAYLVFGKASGFGDDVSTTLEDGTTMVIRRVIDLTGLAAADGFIIQGDAEGDYAGGAVSGVGDVNGDGFADLLVGARSGDDGDISAGEAYLVFGKASDPSDPFGSADSSSRQVVDLTKLAPEDGFIIRGDFFRDRSGGAVSGAGDVNGDGFADLLVGARDVDNISNIAGEAYLLFGKASGFGSVDGSSRQVVDLTGLAPEDGLIIQGDARGDNAGFSVSAAGDVNGDGFADLIVGANLATRTNAGEAYVLFGGPAGLSTETAAGDGVLNVDGMATVVLAGAGDDVLNIDGFGPADLLRFDGGGGTDTLRLNGAGLSLDLSTLADTRLISIERIDLSGGGAGPGGSMNNSLILTRLDLLSLSEVRTEGRAELRVDGNSGDRVSTDDGGWVRQANVMRDDTMYSVFDNGNARLLVNMAIDISGVDEAPTAVTLTPTMTEFTENANITVPIKVADIAVTDADGGAPRDLELAGADADLFALNDDQDELFLRAGAALDFETKPVLDVSVQVAADTTVAATLQITVTDVNEVPTTGGDRAFRVDEGESYTLTVADLSATDIDTADDAAALTWMVLEGGPTNGRLVLSGDLDTPISSFIQARLEAGDVVYVHTNTGTGASPDNFMVRVEDDQGEQADPVTVNIDITRIPVPVIDLSDLTPEDGFIIRGDAGGDRAGRSVSGAGDINGDGYADLIVGAYRGDDAGEAYVLFGKASGFGTPMGGRRVIDLTNLAAGDGFIIQGDAGGDRAGRSVSGAGDVNGDGFADLLVGANQGNDGAGEAYLVFGKASGPSDPFGSLDSTDRRVIDLTSLAPGDGFIIRGDASGDQAGKSVSGAGDVNGDGYADLLIGADFADVNTLDSGKIDAGEAYLVFGKADVFGNLMDGRRVMDVSNLVAGDGFIIQGDMNDDQAGRSVSGAGDVNGDGYADLFIGAPFADFNTPDGDKTDAGAVYVVFGKADGFGAPMGDRRVIDLSNLAAGEGLIIQGDAANDRAGYSVSGVGDVNGDGYADLLVGARFGDDGGDNAGEAYLVFGKASGFGAPMSGHRVIDLSNMVIGDGFIIQGDADGDQAGRSVSGAGDVNGDGYADLLVGAPDADVPTSDGNIKPDAGEAYVLFGGPAGLSTEAVAVLGTVGDDMLNGNGQATVVLAGAGDDELTIDGFGANDLLKFDGGSGTDTLSLVNPDADLSLDLSALADTRLSSIERIDLSGGGDNSLTLTRPDLLNLSEVRTEGRAELRVDGNAGDSVTADDNGWVQQADDTIDGTTYNVFDNGNARLLVNTAVSLGGNLMPPTGLAITPTMAEVLQQYAMGHTVDIRAFIEDLPPEDEEQKRKRLEDELAMLGPLPAAKAAMELAEPAAVAEPDADLFDLPPLIPDEG